MSTTRPPELRTRMFARVLGPFLVVFTATTVARASDMRKLLSDFDSKSALPLVTGGFLLLASLVIIGLHQCWRGAPAVTVSVVGWFSRYAPCFSWPFRMRSWQPPTPPSG